MKCEIISIFFREQTPWILNFKISSEKLPLNVPFRYRNLLQPLNCNPLSTIDENNSNTSMLQLFLYKCTKQPWRFNYLFRYSSFYLPCLEVEVLAVFLEDPPAYPEGLPCLVAALVVFHLQVVHLWDKKDHKCYFSCNRLSTSKNVEIEAYSRRTNFACTTYFLENHQVVRLDQTVRLVELPGVVHAFFDFGSALEILLGLLHLGSTVVLLVHSLLEALAVFDLCTQNECSTL